MIGTLSSLIPIETRGIATVNLTLEIIYMVARNSSIINKITTLMAKTLVCIIFVTRVFVYISLAIYVIVQLTLYLT